MDLPSSVPWFPNHSKTKTCMIIYKTVYTLKVYNSLKLTMRQAFLGLLGICFYSGPTPCCTTQGSRNRVCHHLPPSDFRKNKSKTFPIQMPWPPLKFSKFPTALILLPPSVHGPVPASFARKHSRYVVGVAAWMKTQNVWRCSSVHTAQKRATKHYSKCTMD